MEHCPPPAYQRAFGGFPTYMRKDILGVSMTCAPTEVLFRQLVLIRCIAKLLHDKQGRGSTETTHCYNKSSLRAEGGRGSM